ncbi:hypothetical protein GCM10007916_08340 [Psychromonas marina]|uniref:Transcriptional regulator HTH-type FeoC domain-containing protein n=1 Tax=Psychromonas marina TaxID=88364 RepID=A0ABQ6DXA3_9GAMM|nr:FeoC-like transcriptional regulator [Psychromonas marina]GLS89767.1 hypothetical protein GCM10007916_08340 [Psychromonas marina]
MILQSIYEYVKQTGRIEESALLTHFHLRKEGLDTLLAPLLKRSKIHKTVHQRGENLTPIIYYSCPARQQIASITIV